MGVGVRGLALLWFVIIFLCALRAHADLNTNLIRVTDLQIFDNPLNSEEASLVIDTTQGVCEEDQDEPFASITTASLTIRNNTSTAISVKKLKFVLKQSGSVLYRFKGAAYGETRIEPGNEGVIQTLIAYSTSGGKRFNDGATELPDGYVKGKFVVDFVSARGDKVRLRRPNSFHFFDVNNCSN
ncbi:MAG: hypothetical protein H6619_05655 [Deltaproteobacteria bacterium]|nr:hypothetical protein [Deltaproteobacteria bacterium]